MQAYHIHAQTGPFTGSRRFSTFQFLYVLQSIIFRKNLMDVKVDTMYTIR